MKENEFEEGYIEYKIERKPKPDQTDIEGWTDGYVAFSSGEKRLDDIDLAKINFSEKIKGIEGVDGYLMEIGLWRCKEEYGIYEEISIEREDDGFFVQNWKLYINENKPSCDLCYYRPVDTVAIDRKENRLFAQNELKSMEVVVPKRRLHFFITVGEN